MKEETLIRIKLLHAITAMSKTNSNAKFDIDKIVDGLMVHIESYATHSLPGQISDEVDRFLRNYPEYRCMDVIGKFKEWMEQHKDAINRTVLPRESEELPTEPLEDEIMQQLLNRWGFHEDGAILCGEQLKIFSFMDWLKEKGWLL